MFCFDITDQSQREMSIAVRETQAVFGSLGQLPHKN